MNMHSPVSAAPRFWLIVLITLTGTMAMHIFIPVLPLVARDLGTTAGQIQWTTSVYITGLAVGQLVYGPISDGFGRRPVILLGLAVFLAGSIAAAAAPGFEVLLGARFLQAFGAGAGLALGRAIIRDTAEEGSAIRKIALLNVLIVVGPGLAPFADGIIALHAGWRAIFAVLAAIGAAIFYLTWRLLTETSQATGQVQFQRLFRDGAELLRSPKFGALIVGNGFLIYAIYAVLSAVPFVLVEQLGVPMQVAGICSGLIVLGSAAGNAITARLAVKPSTGLLLLLTGNWLAALSAVVFSLVVLRGALTMPLVVGILFFFSMSTGLANPVALAEALNVAPGKAGSAAGIFGCLQLVIAALLTLLMSLGRDPALSMAVVLCGCAVVSRTAFALALKR